MHIANVVTVAKIRETSEYDEMYDPRRKWNINQKLTLQPTKKNQLKNIVFSF